MLELLGGLGGRKFLMAIAGVVAVVLAAKFGVDETRTMEIAVLVSSFILGQSYADGKSAGATSTTATVE
jgi:hypothetical protein